MSTMNCYTMTDPDIVKVANDMKELTLKTLVLEKLITEKQADDFSSNFAIAAVQPTMFRRIFDKIVPPEVSTLNTFEFVMSTNPARNEKPKKAK